jgi:hypothetical protein
VGKQGGKLEDHPCVRQQGEPGLREFDMPGSAVEQGRTDFILEAADGGR